MRIRVSQREIQMKEMLERGATLFEIKGALSFTYREIDALLKWHKGWPRPIAAASGIRTRRYHAPFHSGLDSDASMRADRMITLPCEPWREA